MDYVLVADDDIAVRMLLQHLLEEEGMHTLAASNGLQALDIVQENEISGAIIDNEMPEMSGLEVIRNLSEKGSDIPVILLTAEKPNIPDDLQSKISLVASKSLGISEILEKAKEYLRKK